MPEILGLQQQDPALASGNQIWSNSSLPPGKADPENADNDDGDDYDADNVDVDDDDAYGDNDGFLTVWSSSSL